MIPIVSFGLSLEKVFGKSKDFGKSNDFEEKKVFGESHFFGYQKFFVEKSKWKVWDSLASIDKNEQRQV